MSRLEAALCELVAAVLVGSIAEPVVAQAWTSSALWNEHESRTALEIQPVIQYGPWGVPNIGRITLGASRRDSLSYPAFSLGVSAAGFVVPLSRVVSAGLFTRSLLREGAQRTQLQAILAYRLGAGWSISAGDVRFTIDWAKGRPNVPLGVQLGVVCPVFEQPIRFFVSPQYSLKDVPGADRFKLLVGIALHASRRDTTNR